MEIVARHGSAATIMKHGHKLHIAIINGVRFSGAEKNAFFDGAISDDRVCGTMQNDQGIILGNFDFAMPIGDAFSLERFEKACAEIAAPYAAAA